jgi:glutamate synthase domain-containing protein 3
MSSSSTELTDTAYDILKVLGKDADFLYDTIETYIKDAQKANKSDLLEIWQTIKKDRQKQMHKSSVITNVVTPSSKFVIKIF